MDSNQGVMVTGSAGFIGRYLTSTLNYMGKSVVTVDREAPVRHDGSALRCDLTELEECAFSALQKTSTIFHLAAVCKEPGYPWRDYFANNAEATRRLCRAAERANINNIIFTSTMMTFAAGPWRRSEDDFCDADTAYGCSKLQAEEILRAWQAAGPGRRLRIVRPGVVFGLGDQGNMRRLIHGLHRKRFAYVGRKDTVKGCIYLKDLVRLLILLSDDAGYYDTYHAVYPQQTTIEDIVGAINRAWDWNRRPPTVPYLLALTAAAPFALLDTLGTRFGVHPRRIQKLNLDTDISASRLSELDFAPQYSLSDAFRDWREECGGGLPT